MLVIFLKFITKKKNMFLYFVITFIKVSSIHNKFVFKQEENPDCSILSLRSFWQVNSVYVSYLQDHCHAPSTWGYMQDRTSYMTLRTVRQQPKKHGSMKRTSTIVSNVAISKHTMLS